MGNSARSSHRRRIAPSVEEMPKTVQCPEPQKLDPRVRRTRALIEDAFRTLLAERPYAEISVADVAARATVNRATFYLHFEDKEHLATSMMREELDAALRARLEHETPLNAATLGSVAEAIFAFFENRMPKCGQRDAQLAPTLMSVLQDTIQSLIRKWLDLDRDAMRLFPGATRDEAATVLAWALYGAALRWSHQRQRPPALEAATRTVALLIRDHP